MFVTENLAALRADLNTLRRESSAPVALVPTMGALHAGHLSLAQRALEDGCQVVATIFVNPTQFAAHEDLESYPSSLEQDLAMLRQQGIAGVWTPKVSTMYPGLDVTRVRLGSGLTQRWEGEYRPHFFEGVATVVTKLLIATLPDRAYFGEKDFQQLKVIEAMTQDLLLPTQILGCPTVRESDGLAMSSRNAYLSAEERALAPALYGLLSECADDVRSDPSPTAVAHSIHMVQSRLLDSGFKNIDYLALVDANSLAPLDGLPKGKDARLIAAATLGSTRLIDNISV